MVCPKCQIIIQSHMGYEATFSMVISDDDQRKELKRIKSLKKVLPTPNHHNSDLGFYSNRGDSLKNSLKKSSSESVMIKKVSFSRPASASILKALTTAKDTVKTNSVSPSDDVPQKSVFQKTVQNPFMKGLMMKSQPTLPLLDEIGETESELKKEEP